LFGILFAVLSQLVNGAGRADLSFILTYVVVGFRLLPSLIKIQNSFTSLKILEPNVLRLILLDEALKSENIEKSDSSDTVNHPNVSDESSGSFDFIPSLSVQGLQYTFADSTESIFSDLALEVSAYEYLGLIGTSGSGKSTLVEICLGLRRPTSGHIRIGGMEPDQAFSRWRRQISYFSQNTYLVNGTLTENIALGLDKSEVNYHQVSLLIESLKLSDFSSDRKLHDEYLIGENGNALSGGQRQRLGLARALYSSPKFLILDEATSSQDPETEEFLTEYIRTLKGKMTIISISHNLNSLKYCDRIIDMPTLISGNKEN
jgi:ABC-type bacteriocin/lantibiotic exporter with double-glycine peptidase domain